MFALNAAKFALRGLGEMREFHAADAMVDRGAKVGADPGGKGAAVAALVIAAMPDDGQEHLVAVALDAHGLPVAYGKVATGSVDNCPLFARDVYAWALTIPGCRFVGIAHNHPSGDVTPSGPDVAGSALVAKGGAMLALELVWSMVVTHQGPHWALVPAAKGKAPQQGEREPHAPKDPDDEPESEPGEPKPEPDAPEPGDEPDDEDSQKPEPGDDDENEPGEPEADGTPNDEPGDDDDTDDDDTDDEDDEPGEDETETETETDGETPDEDGDEQGAPEPSTDEPGPAVPMPEVDPATATAEELRAAVRAAFGLK
jgi:hypothetical protein